MKVHGQFLILSSLLILSTWSKAESAVTSTKLTERIHRLTIDRGNYVVNVIASVGDDGVLLVDTGERETAEELKTAVESVGKGAPKIIVNTHAHVDHTGGNAAFGSAPIIIGHEILRQRLRSGSYLFDEFQDEALPDITFRDSISVFFNGEEIQLLAMGGSHDDNDVVVWFTDSGIVCIGDITNGLSFPSFEEVTGNVLEFPRVVQNVIDRFPDDATFISGHGVDCGKDELRQFKQMVETTAAIVRQGIEAGKDAATLVDEDILKGWESWEGSYVSKDEWIHSLYEALTATTYKRTLYEPLYYALRDHGLDAAIEEYHRLKREKRNEFRFVENDLAFMADKLFRHERFREAIAFLSLCLEEYPEGLYSYYYHYLIGRSHLALGNRAKAISSLRETVKLRPDLAQAKELLAELETDQR